MINPNCDTSKDVLRRLKQASYERMRVELKCSVELLMKDFGWTWDDLGRLLGVRGNITRDQTPGDIAKHRIVQGQVTLNDLNTLAHLFSTEPYILFRPREPWIKI